MFLCLFVNKIYLFCLFQMFLQFEIIWKERVVTSPVRVQEEEEEEEVPPLRGRQEHRAGGETAVICCLFTPIGLRGRKESSW